MQRFLACMKQQNIQLTQIINQKTNKMKKLSLLFAALLAVSTMFADVLSWNASAQGYENAQVIDTVTFGNPVITMTFNKGTNNNAPKYYTTGAAVRCYGGNYFTVDAGANTMTAIDLTFASGGGTNAITTNAGEYADGAWTGSATNVTFTIGGTSGHRRIATISVTLAAAGGDTTVVPVDTTSQDTTPVVPPVQMETLLFNANIWNVTDVNEKYAAWVWGNNLQGQWTDFFTPVDAENTYGVQIPVTADSIVFVRLDNAIDTVTWNNIWNQTLDYAINHADLYFTVEGWGEGENAKSYGTWGTPVVITSLADAMLLAAGTEITTTGIVTYINGKNAYMQDATDGILLYGTSNFTNFQVGDEIVIDAKVASYGNAPELSNVVLRNIVSSENTVNPILMTLAERVANPLQNFGMLVTINELTITAYDNYRNPTFSDGTNTIVGYKFSMDTTAFPIGSVVDVTAIAAYYNNIQIQGNTAGVVMHEYEQVHYYIKNNWDGAEAWTWVEMNPVMNNVIYEHTGVFGGRGVNINTAAEDNGSIWFPVENFSVLDSTFVPQALDTLHFVYSIVDSVLAVELVGRPEPAPARYFIKNNWNGGEWAWVEMNPVMDNVLYEYTGVFGGMGVNINTAAADAGSTWFSVENFSVLDSTYVPQTLDTIHFVYSIVDSVLAVELVGRPEPIIIDSVTTILNITDVTGWENLYVYAWGGAEIFGSWPGEIALEQIIISGNYEGQTEHLIFNNGAGTQLADFDIVLMDTVYNIVVRADGAYFPEDVPTTNTCAEVNAITEATNMTLGEVTVVFAKGSNIYVQDATATTLVYTNKYADLVPGDRVQGIAGQAKLFNGLPELAATTEFADLVVTAGQAPRIPDAKTAPTMADINKVMMFRNVTMLDSAFTTPNNKAMNINGIFNGDTVTFRNNWKDTYTFEQGKTYTMLGCVAVYNNAIQVYVTNIEEYVEVPVQYYIKNNWNGSSAWTWVEMSPVLDNVLYEYTGVFGGTGVNINTTTADEDAIWFPVEKFSLIDSTYVPQALDTIHFVYSIVDATLAVELVGRPAGDSVLHYYIKNNWEAGSEWTWVEMDMVVDSAVYEYTGVFGGTGVNINTMATDAGAIWFPVEDFRTIDSTYVPQALDTIHFVYSIVDSALAVELVGRPVIEEIQYYIKNNWNGGEWTWEEMTPANDGNITWTYRGIFGGTGVNINNLPIDADAIWFPVDEWLFTTLGYEPKAGDDILFEFNSELLTLTATFMGKVGLETITFQREGETMKLIHNGQLYIIRDGKMYNALGAQVR